MTSTKPIKPGPNWRYRAMEPDGTCVQHGAPRVLLVSRMVVVLITLAYIALLARAAQLQLAPEDRIVALTGTQVSQMALDAPRGDLRDRRGRLMATTRVHHVLFVDTTLIDDPLTFPDTLARALGYDAMAIDQALFGRHGSRYVVLDPDADAATIDRLRELNLPAVGSHAQLARHYPLGPTAGQLVGFVGRDRKPDEGERLFGREGMELLYDQSLKPTPGQLAFVRTAARRPLWVSPEGFQPPRDGRDLRMSIDAYIQHIVEEELAAACTQFEAPSGQAVVMDPRTGEVLAMANWPRFDPSDVSTAQPELRRNRCVSDPFEPGSIFKPFVWAALTEMGAARIDETIDTHNGTWVSSRGRRLRDSHGYPRLTWEGVLVKSSNIGMAIVALRTSEAKLHNMVRAFGFGELTGSGLPGESAGIVNPLRRWNHWSMTSVPMGQEIAATPLQLTRAFCAIANGGLMVTPSVTAVDPAQPRTLMQIYERVLSEEAAADTRQALRVAVVTGTGRPADSELYEVFGKTGTAQVPDQVRGGYLEGGYVGSFLAGAPYDRPRIVVGVFVHRPNPAKGYYGGKVAAPAAKAIVDRTLTYLGVAPTPKAERRTIAQR